MTSGLFWLQAALGGTNVWVLLSLFAVQQAFFGVNQPTRSAVLPKIVPLEQLPAATALNITVFQAGAIAGPLVAGVLIPVVGIEWLYLVDALTLLATLSAVVRLPKLPVLHARAGVPGLRAVADGFAYLRHQPVLLMSFVVDLIAMIFGMPRALFPEIAHVDFGGPDAGGLVFALLFAAIPAGAVLGGVFSGWVSRVEAQGRAVIVCILIWGFAMVGFGLAVGLADRWQLPMLLVALLMLVVGGAADMASSAFRNAMLMTAASDEVRGRLQGVFIVVVAGGPRLADTFHGVAAAAVGTAAAAAGRRGPGRDRDRDRRPGRAVVRAVPRHQVCVATGLRSSGVQAGGAELGVVEVGAGRCGRAAAVVTGQQDGADREGQGQDQHHYENGHGSNSATAALLPPVAVKPLSVDYLPPVVADSGSCAKWP